MESEKRCGSRTRLILITDVFYYSSVIGLGKNNANANISAKPSGLGSNFN